MNTHLRLYKMFLQVSLKVYMCMLGNKENRLFMRVRACLPVCSETVCVCVSACCKLPVRYMTFTLRPVLSNLSLARSQIMAVFPFSSLPSALGDRGGQVVG